MKRYAVLAAIVVSAVVTAGVAAQIRQSGKTAGEITVTLLKPPLVPPPVDRSRPATVVIDLETTEVKGVLGSDVDYTFWTFGGTVPGPMLRVRVGDTVRIRLRNAPAAHNAHSIDLHAVTGPGGGSTVTQVAPGEQAAFRFQALKPGVYVYQDRKSTRLNSSH